MNESGFRNDCAEFVIDSYSTVIQASSALVSALCCIFVIFLIFLLKKHYFFIQRIILYHCLAALSDSLATSFNLIRLGYLRDRESTVVSRLCTMAGFTNQLALWILLMDYLVVNFILLMTAVFHKNVARLERLYIVLIFAFPLSFNWIPFIGNSYGETGSWCWIRDINYDNCTEHSLGSTLRVILWYVPFFGFLVVMIPVYLFTIAYAVRERWCKSANNVYRPELERLRKKLREDVWRILFFPVGVIIFNLFILILIIYDSVGATNTPYAIRILHAIFGPLQGGYIALVYTLDRHTLKRLTYTNIKALVTKRDKVSKYPTNDGGDSVSDSVYVEVTMDTASTSF